MCMDVCEAIRKKGNDFMISSLFCPADISDQKKYWQILGFLSFFFFTVIQKSIIKQASLSKIENIANIGRLEAKAKYIGRLEILPCTKDQWGEYKTFKAYCNPRFNR